MSRLGRHVLTARRKHEQLSRAGYDMPMQAREVLEDLRLGRMMLRTEDPGLPGAADRLGRRVFSGVVVAALLGSGVYLVNGERHATLGLCRAEPEVPTEWSHQFLALTCLYQVGNPLELEL